MNKTKMWVAIGTVVVLIIGSIMVVKWKRDRAVNRQAARIQGAVAEIKLVNVALPDLQVEAKALIFTALIQKKIPAVSKWCETLNVNGKLWPTTPTNTFFAMNPAVAGRVYSKTNRLAGDVVVFFETASAGWNLAGGSDLMASRPEGVAVALADGRSMLMKPADAAKLRWIP